MLQSTNDALATYMELAQEKFRLYSKIHFESQCRSQKIATARKAWSCLNCNNRHISIEFRMVGNRWLNAELLKAYGVS